MSEEEGITKDTAGAMTCFAWRLAIGGVGNYGEMYTRQAEVEVRRGGLNELNPWPGGPQMFPIPGINV